MLSAVIPVLSGIAVAAVIIGIATTVGYFAATNTTHRSDVERVRERYCRGEISDHEMEEQIETALEENGVHHD